MDTFNNFACDIPSPCAPPIVPRLGKSGGKSYPFNPVSTNVSVNLEVCRDKRLPGPDIEQLPPKPPLTRLRAKRGTLLHF